jgi:hypothetical protein
MKTTIATILTLTFSALVLCGIGAFAVHTHHDMGACPFAAKLEVLCPPQTAEHLAQLAFYILSIITSVVALALASTFGSIANPSFNQTRYRIPQKPPRNMPPLQLALSDGILQPKVFWN